MVWFSVCAKLIVAIFVAGAMAGCTGTKKSTHSIPKASQCHLSEADLLRNRQLNWAEFDQSDTIPKTWRALQAADCHSEAITAYTDYLAYGPVPAGERWQTTARFHLAQSLALAGRETEAARMMASARRQVEVGGLHWNGYVQATVAFLQRDRAMFDQKLAELRAEDGFADRVNARVLAGLSACWNKPYALAYSPQCQAASGVPLVE